MFVLRRHRLDLLVCCAALGLLASIAWQATYGGRSFRHYDELGQRLASLQGDLATVGNERKTLEERVQLMRPESVDRDLLDEFARRDLNMAKSNDVVVLLKN